jgi:hypothetical protein
MTSCWGLGVKKGRIYKWCGLLRLPPSISTAVLKKFSERYTYEMENSARRPLNDWGDFLSGVTAPIAFLWLILGYFQQSEELRQNTDALLLQKRELERQAEETAKLARFSAQQAEATATLAKLSTDEQERALLKEQKAAEPQFVFYGGSNEGGLKGQVTFKNVGGPIRDLVVTPIDDCNVSISPSQLLETNAAAIVGISHPNRPNGSVNFMFSYTDSLGRQGKKVIKYGQGQLTLVDGGSKS